MTLKDVARLDTVVTVIDCFNFLNDMQSAEDLKDRNWQTTDEDDRDIAQLLVDQVEFANVVILNKTDLVTPEQAKTVEGIVKKLNPEATLLTSVHSKVPLTLIFNTHLFDFDKAQKNPGWMKVC